MKKVSLIFALSIGLVAIGAVGIGMWYQHSLLPLSSDVKPKRFVITKGSNVTEIAQKLESEGIIKSALTFKFYTQINGLSDKIFAGEFQLSPSFSVPQIIEKLQSGPSQVWITFPEGLRREQTATKAADGLELTGEKRDEFINQFLTLSKNNEGYLYPDTYLFPKDATAEMVVKKLTQTLEQKISSEIGDLSKVTNKSLKEILTMASILERETKNIKSEGNLVAGVLWKRVEAGWPVQADATVQYAIGTSNNWWPTPTRANLEVNSPYNTYKIQGLPPTPIASPGIEAIKAAAAPQESEYWFYIHDTKGQIHFAKTLAEHNQNIEQYLR